MNLKRFLCYFPACYHHQSTWEDHLPQAMEMECTTGVTVIHQELSLLLSGLISNFHDGMTNNSSRYLYKSNELKNAFYAVIIKFISFFSTTIPTLFFRHVTLRWTMALLLLALQKVSGESVGLMAISTSQTLSGTQVARISLLALLHQLSTLPVSISLPINF